MDANSYERSIDDPESDWYDVNYLGECENV